MANSNFFIAGIFIALLALTSCQKRYICECRSTNLASSYGKSYPVHARNAFDAQKECSSNTSETDAAGNTVICQLR
jgi:hypothetical protein